MQGIRKRAVEPQPLHVRLLARLIVLALLTSGLVGSIDAIQQPSAQAVTAWSGVSVGGDFNCAIGSGQAYCWGHNQYGQLGDGTQIDRSAPQLVNGGNAFTTVTAGMAFACALTSAGAAWCWGDNYNGNLGNASNTSSLVPVLVSGGVAFTKLKANGYTVCGLTSANVAYCWGDNDFGQIGNNSNTDRNVPTAVQGGLNFTQIEPGSHTCAVATSGLGYCWGINYANQLGTAVGGDKQVPTVVSGGFTYSTISPGYNSTCGIRTTNNRVYCWGSNYNGHLGDGTTTDRATPTMAVSGSGSTNSFTSVEVGNTFACAIDTTPRVYCWGGNYSGEIGNNTRGNTLSVPTATTNSAMSSISANMFSSQMCGVSTSNVTRCWGYGPPGDGTTTGSYVLTPVNGSPAYTSISAGTDHSCGLLSDGTAYCWGANLSGEVGDGTKTERIAPVAVNTALKFTKIVTGNSFTCALVSSGAAYCWGANFDGRLGVGDNTERLVPTAVTGGLVFTEIAVGEFTTCAIRQSTLRAYCWGWGDSGQIGNGGNVSVNTPTLTSGSNTYSAIAVSTFATCGVKTNNVVSCWGYGGDGQLGDGTTTNHNTPADIPSFAATSIAGGRASFCAIQQTTNLGFCWGYGGDGQLGDSTYTSRSVPTQIQGGRQLSAIAAGFSSGCAITTANAGYCWGGNFYGQLGTGNQDGSGVPSLMLGGYTLSKISIGMQHACTIASSVPRCTGTNSSSQLGTNFTPRLVPFAVDFPPEAPTSLGQFRTDGTTTLATGASTNQGSVVFKGTLADTDAADTVQLCIELRAIGTAFTGSNTSCGTAGSQGVLSVTAAVTSGTTYHWQVRSLDVDGSYSPWTQFNSGAAAFIADAGTPTSPTTGSMKQYRNDGTTLIATGGWYNSSMVFKSTVVDSASSVQLCVEIKALGTAFDGAGSTCSILVASNTTATVTATPGEGQYHWRARAVDAAGNTSGWTAYGANAETVRDFGIDTTAPTGGTVNDGLSTDVAANDGSLSALSANWSFADSASGLSVYTVSVGTTPGATDIKSDTFIVSDTFITFTGLALRTGQTYYFNVRAQDAAGNPTAVFSSNGQIVAPSLSLTVGATAMDFGSLSSGNSYTGISNTSVQIATNAYGGYVLRARIDSPMSTNTGQSIGGFNGGTYAAPDAWLGGDTGFGYTSTDALVGGSNRYQATTCPGGTTRTAPGCYAPFSASNPGDVIMDNLGPITGTAANDTFTFHTRLTAPAMQSAGSYSATVVLSAVPAF